MQYQSYNYKSISQYDIIRYKARQEGNTSEPYKYRNFLVARVNNGILELIPITHSGYDPNSNNPNNNKFKADPMSMFNVKFPQQLQLKLDKATNNSETSFFNTAQIFSIDQKQLSQTKLEFVTTFNNLTPAVNEALKDIKQKQYDISNRNLDYQDAMSSDTFYNQSTIEYNCKHGIWIDDDTLSKTAIAPDIDPDIQSKYPLNMHPIHEPDYNIQDSNDFEY